MCILEAGMKFEAIRHNVSSPRLREYIKFFWTVCNEGAQINHKVLPMKNIDILIDLSPASANDAKQTADYGKMYFMGLSDGFDNVYLQKPCGIDIIGISFYPYGFFPFIKNSVSAFRNQILNISEVLHSIENMLCDKLLSTNSRNNRLAILETELLGLLDSHNSVPHNFQEMFCHFISGSLNISDFCKRHSISSRQFERLFDKYVGTSPKSYCKIVRFQNSLKHLLSGSFERLSDVAYANGYYDQMHFIREFKKFTGQTPTHFQKQESFLKQKVVFKEE